MENISREYKMNVKAVQSVLEVFQDEQSRYKEIIDTQGHTIATLSMKLAKLEQQMNTLLVASMGSGPTG